MSFQIVGGFRSHLMYFDGQSARCVEQYLSNGARDVSRCRYFVNGRKVRHAAFQRWMRAR